MPDHLVIIEFFEKLTSQCHFKNYGVFYMIAQFYLRIISWVLYCVLWPTDEHWHIIRYDMYSYVPKSLTSKKHQVASVHCVVADGSRRTSTNTQYDTI